MFGLITRYSYQYIHFDIIENHEVFTNNQVRANKIFDARPLKTKAVKLINCSIYAKMVSFFCLIYLYYLETLVSLLLFVMKMVRFVVIIVIVPYLFSFWFVLIFQHFKVIDKVKLRTAFTLISFGKCFTGKQHVRKT